MQRILNALRIGNKKKTTKVIAEKPVKAYDCQNIKAVMRGRKPKLHDCEGTCGCSYVYTTESQMRKEMGL